MRLALALLMLAACRNWDDLSSELDSGSDGGTGGSGGSGVGGGATASGGGAASTGGGSAAGGGSAMGGGTGGGSGGTGGGATVSGGGAGGGGNDPTSCNSRGTFTCPAALFCDGFDEQQFNVAWSVDQSNGTITDADSCKYRGSRSAHSLLDPLAPTVKGHAQITETDSGMPADLFVRAFVRVDSAQANATRLITLRPPTPSTDEVFLFYGAGHLDVSGTVTTPSSQHPFALSRWTCVEWELHPGSMNVWVDGANVIDGGFTLASLERVVLGAQVEDHANDLDAGTEIWLDDLVVATSHIGCN